MPRDETLPLELDYFLEAFAAERPGERWWAPEIYRTLGHALLSLPTPDVVEAENCFRRGIAEARQAGALMLELRAATSLAKILMRTGNSQEARRMLAPVVAQFDEEGDGGDLRTAMDISR